MASMATFIRNTPTATLRAYFQHAGIALPATVNWSTEAIGFKATGNVLPNDTDVDAGVPALPHL